MEFKKVGLIGVGLMGHGIAKNLIKHNWQTVFLNHEGNQPVDDLINAGGRGVDSIEEIGAECDVVIICVSGTPQVEQIVLGEGGLIASMKEGAVIVDCSTSLPESSKVIAVEAALQGIAFLDAPMTRTSKEAEEGRLNLLVGGDADLFKKCEPLLQAFAENIIHVGGVGTGHAIKLVHNFVSLGFSTILSEAAACAEKAGIDPKVLVEVLAKGGGNSVVLERFKPQLLEGDPSGMEFSIANAAKDLDYYCQMANALGNNNHCSKTVKEQFEKFIKHGDGDRHVPSMVELLKH